MILFKISRWGHPEINRKFKMAAMIQNGCNTVSRKSNCYNPIKVHVTLFVFLKIRLNVKRSFTFAYGVKWGLKEMAVFLEFALTKWDPLYARQTLEDFFPPSQNICRANRKLPTVYYREDSSRCWGVCTNELSPCA